MKLARTLALAAAIAVAALATPGNGAAQATLIPVRVSINPHFITYLAFFVAVDKGYFRDAGLDLQLSKYTTSANSQLPMLARGDLDVSVVVPGPALFNQYDQGFDAHVIASIDEAHPGYLDGSVLMVRHDLVGKIKKPLGYGRQERRRRLRRLADRAAHARGAGGRRPDGQRREVHDQRSGDARSAGGFAQRSGRRSGHDRADRDRDPAAGLRFEVALVPRHHAGLPRGVLRRVVGVCQRPPRCGGEVSCARTCAVWPMSARPRAS